MENKINWNDWLKRRTLLEIEMALLTLGLNPDNFGISYFDGHYLEHRDLLQDLEKTFDRRMDFIRDYRFTPYEYMSNDGVGGNCYFSIEGSLNVKRFLLWLKNEDMGWDLPPELKTFIDLMGESKNSFKDMPKDAPKSQLIGKTENSSIDLRDRKYSEFEEDKKKFKSWAKCAEHYGISRQRYDNYRRFADTRDNPPKIDDAWGKNPRKK